jgi:hypothetical protein
MVVLLGLGCDRGVKPSIGMAASLPAAHPWRLDRCDKHQDWRDEISAATRMDDHPADA